MRTPKHTPRNVHHLADEVTDTMPQDALVQFFYDDQYDYYKEDPEAFLRDWFDMEMDEKLETYDLADEVE